jgi:hypothetical protein
MVVMRSMDVSNDTMLPTPGALGAGDQVGPGEVQPIDLVDRNAR